MEAAAKLQRSPEDGENQVSITQSVRGRQHLPLGRGWAPAQIPALLSAAKFPSIPRLQQPWGSRDPEPQDFSPSLGAAPCDHHVRSKERGCLQGLNPKGINTSQQSLTLKSKSNPESEDLGDGIKPRQKPSPTSEMAVLRRSQMPGLHEAIKNVQPGFLQEPGLGGQQSCPLPSPAQQGGFGT